MSEEIKDGGPAFPCDRFHPCPCGRAMEVTGHAGGMTKLERFAEQAMRMLIRREPVYGRGDLPIYDAEAIAKEAFLQASAMIKESDRWTDTGREMKGS